ncbi:hypothetical protein [Paraburkholderia sp.]|uniref:hypothetical protein n=1 Tax=Paraburkholderia sp. TaxID=1926495 RepID=UPI003D6FC013
MKVAIAYIEEPPYPALTAIGVTCLPGFGLEIKVTARALANVTNRASEQQDPRPF